MKKLFFVLIAAFSLINMAHAQPVVNDPLAEKRTVGSFHAIDVSTGIEVFLSEGSTEELAVSASAVEYRDKIITRLENGILRIYFENKLNINTKHVQRELKVYVSFKNIDKIEASTGSRVKIMDVLKSPELIIHATEGAEINGKVSSAHLQVKQNTGSRITLEGDAASFEGEGDTGSKFTGAELITNSCHVKVSTGAIISINADKELSAKANTGGVIRYKGSPEMKEINRNTGGVITKI